MTELLLRPVEPADVDLLLTLIRELAQAEEFPFPVSVTREDIAQNLFGAHPAAEALLGFVGDEPACFAVFYSTFATTTGKRGLHLDDLFVRPSFQGRGFGKELLAHLARIAQARSCARFEWWALRANTRAIGFFQSMGARQMGELVIFRAQGDSLRALMVIADGN